MLGVVGQQCRVRLHGALSVTVPSNSTEAQVPSLRYDQYLMHAHNHITRAVAAMDSWFALIEAHQLGAALESTSGG